MKIVHGSDWHGVLRDVPHADLYVFTGDMLDNYPIRRNDRLLRTWEIDTANEVVMQRYAVDDIVGKSAFKKCLGNPDAPIVCVRGNHDFIDIGSLFEGCNLVHEFVDNEVISLLGMKITGHRGIPFIYGTWNDEVEREELLSRAQAIPSGIDLLLTHYPPALVLDAEMSKHGKITTYGLGGMVSQVVDKLNDNGLHCFGHIHGSGGRTEVINTVTFSNAATTFNVIEI